MKIVFVITLHWIDCTQNKCTEHEYISFFIHDPKQARYTWICNSFWLIRFAFEIFLVKCLLGKVKYLLFCIMLIGRPARDTLCCRGHDIPSFLQRQRQRHCFVRLSISNFDNCWGRIPRLRDSTLRRFQSVKGQSFSCTIQTSAIGQQAH